MNKIVTIRQTKTYMYNYIHKSGRRTNRQSYRQTAKQTKGQNVRRKQLHVQLLHRGNIDTKEGVIERQRDRETEKRGGGG